MQENSRIPSAVDSVPRITRTALQNNPALALCPPLDHSRPKFSHNLESPKLSTSSPPISKQFEIFINADHTVQPISKMTTPDEIQALVEKRVPLFYGQPDVEISEVHFFTDACKRLEKRFRGEANATKLLLEEIILRLRGRAYELFRDSPVTKFNDFYDEIARNYLPRYSIETLREKLLTAKQTRNETCTQFANRVLSLALDYESGVQSKYGENNSLPKPLIRSMEQEAFIQGLLNPTIKASLVVTGDKPMKELILLAEKLESKLMPSMSQEYMPHTSLISENCVKCQLCSGMGHSAYTCPNLKRMAFPEKYNTWHGDNNHVENNRSPLFCKYCKKRGHVLDECFSKKRADERRSNTYQNYHQPKNIIPKETFPHRKQNFNYPPRDQTTNHNLVDWTRRQRPPVQYNKNYLPNSRDPSRQNEYGADALGLDNEFSKLKINYLESEQAAHGMFQENQDGLADEK